LHLHGHCSGSGHPVLPVPAERAVAA
jgi:hypothetical protein